MPKTLDSKNAYITVILLAAIIPTSVGCSESEANPESVVGETAADTVRFPSIPLMPAEKNPSEKNIAEINRQLHQLSHTPVTSQNQPDFEEDVRKLVVAGGDINALDPRTGSAPLHAAAVYGSDETIESLVSLGANVDFRSRTGATSLHGAAALGRIDICKALLDQGADPKLETADGHSVLQLAIRAREHNPEVVELLREHLGNDLSLLEAAEAGDLDAVTSKIKNGEDVDQQDAEGRTPLFLAAENGHLEVCRVLLSHGADVTLGYTPKTQEKLITPLKRAIARENSEVAKLLLTRSEEYKADELADALDEAVLRNDAEVCGMLLTTSIPDNAIDGAFHMALTSRSSEMVDKFLQHGYELPLWAACRLNRTKDIRELIAAGANVNSPDADGIPPIVYAVQQSNKESVALLIEGGADVNASSRALGNMTPLHIAITSTEIMQLLIAAGANVNAMTSIDFRTPLHRAVETNRLGAAELLLENGANPNPADLLTDPEEKKRVDSWVSLADDNKEMVRLLKRYGARD